MVKKVSMNEKENCKYVCREIWDRFSRQPIEIDIEQEEDQKDIEIKI